MVIIIIPIVTNSIIFLVYDSYLKKNYEKLDKRQRIFYEKFFENDLENENKLGQLLNLISNENMNEFEKEDEEIDSNRAKSDKSETSKINDNINNLEESMLKETKENNPEVVYGQESTFENNNEKAQKKDVLQTPKKMSISEKLQ